MTVWGFRRVAAFAVAAGGLFVAGAVASQADDGRGRDRDNVQSQASRCVTTPLKGSRIVDARTLVVSDWHGSAAVLTLSGPCLKEDQGLVLLRFSGIGEQICDARDVDIVGQADSNIPLSCAVTSVQLMRREEAEGYAPDGAVL